MSRATQRAAPGKGHLLPALEISSLRQGDPLPSPGPAAVFVNSAAPRGSARGRQKERRPAEPPASLRAGPPQFSAPHPGQTRGGPRRRGSPAAGRLRAPLPFPSLPKANFSAGALYLFGGFAAAQPAVSAAHPPPGAPGRRPLSPGPPEDPAVRAPLRAPRLPAPAAGETLKLNLKAQPGARAARPRAVNTRRAGPRGRRPGSPPRARAPGRRPGSLDRLGTCGQGRKDPCE